MEPIKIVLKTEYRREGIIYLSDGSQFEINSGMYKDAVNHNFTFTVAPGYETSYYVIVRENSFTWPRRAFVTADAPELKTSTKDSYLPYFVKGDKVVLKERYREEGYYSTSGSNRAYLNNDMLACARAHKFFTIRDTNNDCASIQEDVHGYRWPVEWLEYYQQLDSTTKPDSSLSPPLYKSGDKVQMKVFSELGIKGVSDCIITNCMAKFSGKIVTINRVSQGYTYNGKHSYYFENQKDMQTTYPFPEDAIAHLVIEPDPKDALPIGSRKFKVGDKVVIKKELSSSKDWLGSTGHVTGLDKYSKEKLINAPYLTISYVFQTSATYSVDESNASLFEDWLEPYKEEKKMSKSDNYKFKEGDRVVVKAKNRNTGTQPNGVQINDDMLRHINGHMCLTIASSDYKESAGKYYRIEEDGNDWIWCEEWLELYEEKPIKPFKAKKIIKKIVDIVKGEPEPKVDEYGFYVGQKVKLKLESIEEALHVTSNMMNAYMKKGYVTIAKEYDAGYRVMEDHLTHTWHPSILEPYTVASIDKNQKLPIQIEDEKKFILKPIKSLTIITEE